MNDKVALLKITLAVYCASFAEGRSFEGRRRRLGRRCRGEGGSAEVGLSTRCGPVLVIAFSSGCVSSVGFKVSGHPGFCVRGALSLGNGVRVRFGGGEVDVDLCILGVKEKRTGGVGVDSLVLSSGKDA